MADINVIEGEKIKIPTVLLLDLIKRTIELIETSKVVEKNGLKTGCVRFATGSAPPAHARAPACVAASERC